MRFKSLLAFPVVVLALTVLPSAAQAQGYFNYNVGLMATVGGTTGSDPDPGVDNFGFQASFGYQIDRYSLFKARLGQLELDADEPGGLFDTELTYLTLGGEYLINAGAYESGLFLGLGFYDLDAAPLVEDESSLGINLGTSGSFRLTDRLNFVVEFSVHYADLDYAQFFYMGHAGVAFRF